MALVTLADFNGGVVTTSLINSIIKAIQQLQGVKATKSIDESLASNTTAQNDDELVIAVAANTTYVIDSLFAVTGTGSSTLGNIKVNWTFPTSSTLIWTGAGMATNNISAATTEGIGEWIARTNTTSPSTGIPFGTPSTNVGGIIGRGLLIVGANAGSLQLQWAQNTSDAGATTMKANSYVRGVPIA